MYSIVQKAVHITGKKRKHAGDFAPPNKKQKVYYEAEESINFCYEMEEEARNIISQARDLSERIGGYIRSDTESQQYWPLVKKVTLYVPGCSVLLDRIVLVDLPGAGDANKCRDQMWKEYLGKCSSVWIVNDITRAISDKTAMEIQDTTIRNVAGGGECHNITYICTKSDDINPRHLKSQYNLTDEALGTVSSDKKELKNKCILYRNIKVKELVRKAFNKKIEEMLLGTDVNSTEFKVFTVSSADFLNNEESEEHILDRDETELPALKEHIKDLYVSHSQKAVKDYVSKVSGIVSFLHIPKENTSTQTEDLKDKLFSELKQKFETRLQDLAKFFDGVYTKMTNNLDEGVENAEEQCLNALKVLKPEKPNYSGYHKTLKALCRCSGYYRSRDGTTVDLNYALVLPMYAAMDNTFVSCFRLHQNSRSTIKGAFDLLQNDLITIDKRKHAAVNLRLTYIKTEDWKEELLCLVENCQQNAEDGESENEDSEDEDSEDEDSEDDEYTMAKAKIKAVYGEIGLKQTYDELQRSAVEIPNTHKKTITSNSASDLSKAISGYIRSDTESLQYWPLVKKVTVYVPGSSVLLDRIVLVDLPGAGDANKCRDQMWKEYLGKCSSVWIVNDITRAADEQIAMKIQNTTIRNVAGGGECHNITYICTKSDIINERDMKSQHKLTDEALGLTKKLLGTDVNSTEFFKVFTVSSADFWNNEESEEHILDRDETELPALREHIKDLYVSHSQKAVKDYVSKVSGIVSFLHIPKENTRTQTEDLKDKLFSELKQKFETRLQDLAKFFDGVYTTITNNLDKGVKKAEDQCLKNALKVLKPKKTKYSGYHKTLKALCRCSGYYRSRDGKTVDLNYALVLPMYASMDNTFVSCFRPQRALCVRGLPASDGKTKPRRIPETEDLKDKLFSELKQKFETRLQDLAKFFNGVYTKITNNLDEGVKNAEKQCLKNALNVLKPENTNYSGYHKTLKALCRCSGYYRSRDGKTVDLNYALVLPMYASMDNTFVSCFRLHQNSRSSIKGAFDLLQNDLITIDNRKHAAVELRLTYIKTEDYVIQTLKKEMDMSMKLALTQFPTDVTFPGKKRKHAGDFAPPNKKQKVYYEAEESMNHFQAHEKATYKAEIDFITKEASDLSREISGYIRSDTESQQYWPLVKKVTVYVPGSSVLLDRIVLVDLPGAGDANKCRDQMWKEYLGKCSSVWIVNDITRAISDKTAMEIQNTTIRNVAGGGECHNITYICTKSDIINPRDLKREHNLTDEALGLTKKLLGTDANSTEFFKVFTVSSEDFWNNEEREEHILDRDETELPALREHIKDLYVSHSQKAVKDYVSKASGIVSFLHIPKENTRTQTEDLKDKLFSELKQKFETRLQDLAKFFDGVYTKMTNNLDEGVKKAEDQCLKNALKVLKPDDVIQTLKKEMEMSMKLALTQFPTDVTFPDVEDELKKMKGICKALELDVFQD
ncbi:UNVERIFIED_CONTAM: hypothetical protein FKN15_046581 [Acipenser sinensis]